MSNIIRTAVETISPERAKRLLLMTPPDSNRPLHFRHVEFLKSEILGLRYALNGESIVIFVGPGGREEILDGQHRLQAILQSGVSVESVVVYVNTRDVFSTFDGGRRRSASDCLAIQQHGTRQMSASTRQAITGAARLLVMFRTGEFKRESCKPGNTQITDYIAQNEGIIDRADALCKMASWRKWPVPLSAVLALLHMVDEQFPSAREDFFARLADGAGLPADSPILALRNRGMNSPLGRDTASCLALVIIAWNAWVLGKPMKLVRFVANVQAYPRPITSPPSPEVNP